MPWGLPKDVSAQTQGDMQSKNQQEVIDKTDALRSSDPGGLSTCKHPSEEGFKCSAHVT